MDWIGQNSYSMLETIANDQDVKIVKVTVEMSYQNGQILQRIEAFIAGNVLHLWLLLNVGVSALHITTHRKEAFRFWSVFSFSYKYSHFLLHFDFKLVS